MRCVANRFSRAAQPRGLSAACVRGRCTARRVTFGQRSGAEMTRHRNAIGMLQPLNMQAGEGDSARFAEFEFLSPSPV